MVEGNGFAPLSPPTSPRMSAFATNPEDLEWQDQQVKGGETTPPASDSSMSLLHAEVGSLPLDAQKRPMLRNHKSFPYPLRQSNGTPSNSQLDAPGDSPVPQRDRITISNLEDVNSSELPTVSYGGSAPASPVSRLTPPSLSGEKTEDQEEAHDTDFGAGNTEEDEQDQKPPMSAAELRAQKRKMKRFRLTHNQTRFLMSEFARQAHPDAAHRERLAREIPGLSPRQVQVWFQNRRAKLKRLTSDDRERMMRSRALPDDFDMTQALHSPFGASHGVGTPLASPSNYSPAFPEGNMVRPLTLDTLRRLPEGAHMSPTSITPAFGGFAFTPPQSATDNLSPVSASAEQAPFGYSQPIDTSPRRSNPFIGSPTSAPGYPTSHPQIPRLSLHDRLGRSRAESLSSPLRTSVSYTTAGSDGDYGNGINGTTQSLDGSQFGGDRGLNNMSPYGLGYSYNQIPGFQAGATTRMRSFSGGVPRRIELSTSYTSSARSNAPQTATFPNFQGSPLSAPPDYGINHMSAPHHITSFQNSYLRHDGTQQDQFPQVGSVLGEISDGQDQNGDSHDGVNLQQTYSQGL